MTNRFMMSVAAAALIAGTGFAYAQGTGTSSPSAGSTAQQSAPSSAPTSASPMNRDSSDKGGPAAKTTKSEEKATQPGGTKSQRAQDEMKGGQKSEKSAQDNMKGDRSKSMSSETDSSKGAKDKDMKAEGRGGNTNAQGREDRMNAEQKGAVDSRSQTTTGQAGAAAKLSTEQRTKITGVIRNQHVAPLNNVNFQVSVGARVPRDVTFYPLPQEVVSIYPEWREYRYILVRDQILVVDPRTFEIVAVLEA
jgi:hypothetical protein